MKRQQSFTNQNPTLFLISTPIGNLEDMTFRAVNVLKSVDVCFAEDTRVTRVLFDHYGIQTKLECYQEHNKEHASLQILAYLEAGKNVGLVSDAGNPIISDPGFLISKMAIDKGYNVVPIPGASASLTALIASGINASNFMFYGFLDSKSSKRKKELENLKNVSVTLIFYEAPHRIKEMLEDLLEVFGNRNIALCRELTKKFEEFYRGTVEEVLEVIDTVKGEIVLICEGKKEDASEFSEDNMIEQIDDLILAGMNKNNAIKMVAKRMNIDKQELYKKYIEEKTK